MKITFDPAKPELTLRERGLDFADAGEVFAGDTFSQADARIDYGEARFISAGYLRGRMVIIVWTPRNDARHIISLRHCHAQEERYWCEQMGRS